MQITIAKHQNIDVFNVVNAIEQSINQGSRFNCRIEVLSKNRIKLRNVRLDAKKRYCGNHPNACEVQGRGRMGNYLEGLDWVEFNDRINDIFDHLNVEANVYTSVCWIRRGRRRRVCYGSHLNSGFFGTYVWDRDGEDSDYEDYCGTMNAPDSEFPYGTPGEYAERVAS
jgi:hypothetical protein